MKKKNYNFSNISKSLSFSELSSFHYQNTPKKPKNLMNLYNFKYLSQSLSPYINVFCKFRPINELELIYSKKDAVRIQSSKHLYLKIEPPILTQEFIFDEIFEPNTHKFSFYNKTCKNIVSHAIQGYNGGIIFYGESGTGKTYTIKQIIPQIIKQIYEEIGISDRENEVFKIKVALFEIYKEQINDLLQKENTDLNIVELKNKKVEINNLTYLEVNNEIELNDAIMKGFSNKNKNNDNKKSHSFIEIKIYRYYRDKNIMKYSKLQIAELKIKEGHSMNKENNKSIDVLKMVVKKLNIRNEGNEEEFDIPYRKSKLTMILKDCFGGNSYTSFILTCTKSEYHINQTSSVFILGQNIRKIKNQPVVNVEVNADKNPIMKGIIVEDNKKFSNEINSLKKLNNRYQEKIEKDQIIIQELNDKVKIMKSEEINNNNLYEYFNNISKDKKELNNNHFLKSQKISNELANNQNNTNYAKKIIDDLLSDKNYYFQQIDKYKSQIEDFKSMLKEKEKKIQDLNDELNGKKGEIVLLQIEKEKILNKYEGKLSENQEQILNLEEKMSDERKKMENNLYTQIKNSEAIIRELREAKSESDSQVEKFKKNTEVLNNRIKELEIKYKNVIEDKEKINYNTDLEVKNYKIKLSQLNNEIFLKDSSIKKMNGEIQILKSELLKMKENDNNLLNSNISLNNKKEEIDSYTSKIKDLQNELNTIKIKQNNEQNELNQKLFKINDLEQKLKANESIINDCKSKYSLIDKELNETKTLVFNLNKQKENLLKEKDDFQKNCENTSLKDKEILILKQDKNKIEMKNIELEKELMLLKKMNQNIQNDNDSLRKKMNDYEEIKLELECLKNRGNNYSYIEINRSTLKQDYDKLLNENKQLKEALGNKTQNN